MADKPINSLPQATDIADNDSFVLEQNAAAKKLTGKTLLEVLLRKLDGHGGIKSIKLMDSNSFTLEDSYLITYTDGSTQIITIKNGRGIVGISLTDYSETIDTYTIVYNDSTTSTFEVRHGSDGKDGKNAYVWIRYASQMPSDSSPSFGSSPDRWIGIYSGSESSAPTEWSAYDWYDMKGERGVAIYRVNGTNKPLERYSYSDLIMPYGYKPMVNDLVVTTDGYLGYVSQVFDDAELVDITSTDISINGKSAYQYAVEAGYDGTEEEFASELLESNFIVDLVEDGSGGYNANKTYYEIADAKASDKLVLLRYGAYITHILAGEPTESSFLFEPLLHSVPGMPGYTVDINDSWSTVAVTTPGTEGESDIFIGTMKTPVSDFLSEFYKGKACFLRNPYDELVDNLWMLSSVSIEVARFYTITAVGEVRTISLFYDGSWNSTNIDLADSLSNKVDFQQLVTTIDKNNTDNQVPTAKAVHAAVKGKLDATELPTAVNDALAKAKESGEFKGDTGATGADGATGAAGKSAYQYAKENGYTGTETEFGIKLAKDIPTVTQEAGQSETLVMSQKAVTDLVADALKESSKTEYETVDSVDEMTDTAKSYVLNSTGTIWAYGETAPQPAYTDLTEQTGWAWTKDKRISSSGGESDAAGTYITDYIPCAFGDTIRIKGLNITTLAAGGNANLCWYKSDKTATSAGTATAKSFVDAGVITYENDAYVIPACANVSGVQNTQAVYQRFCGKLEDGYTIEDVIITKNEEIEMVAGYGWYDTGMTPESVGNGNYVDLLVKVNENAADIAEVSARVAALESGSETLTVPSFWQDAVDICIAKIKALQVGRNCVTFPFFSDNHQRNGYAGALIAKVMKECHIPYCFYGGDSISNGTIADEATMIEQDKAFDTIMSYVPNGRLCRAVGNHDGYWYDGTSAHTYTREQVYELFLREEAIAQNKHFGDDGTYYYADDLASKVRFIVLNTNGGSVDDAQIVWFRDTALKVETGWAVVVISHQPISNHYHANISNAADVRNIVTESGTDIIGWFSGHIHRDRIYTGAATNTTDDTEGDAMGFTQVTITSDHTGIAYDDATKHTVANDDQSHAIDFVTINRNTRTVNLTRLGIGEDRSFSY